MSSRRERAKEPGDGIIHTHSLTQRKASREARFFFALHWPSRKNEGKHTKKNVLEWFPERFGFVNTLIALGKADSLRAYCEWRYIHILNFAVGSLARSRLELIGKST